MIQLDLFEKNDLVLVLNELKRVRESSEAVRRGVFRRVAELEQKLKELQEIRIKVAG
jgi:hypothetical protein